MKGRAGHRASMASPARPQPSAEAADYVRHLAREGGDALLRDLERDAAARKLPLLGPAAGRLVASLARTRGGPLILDVGTGNGYGAVWLGRVARETLGRVVSVEKDAAMVREARANLARGGLDGVVEVVHADALAYLQEKGDAFDLVLLDLPPAERAAALPAIVPRLRPRGLLLALGAADAAGRAYTSLALSDERLDTSVMYGLWPGHEPEWDALAISVRRASGSGAHVAPLG